MNDLGLRIIELCDVRILTDRLNAVAEHRDGLPAQNRSVLRARRNTGINIRADEDDVGPGAWSNRQNLTARILRLPRNATETSEYERGKNGAQPRHYS